MKAKYFICILLILFSAVISGCKNKSYGKYKNVKQERPLEPENASISEGFTIKPRSDWTNEEADVSKTVPMTAIFRLTIHHTAMPEDESEDLGGDTKVRLQKILQGHKQHHQWADIGYHFIIDFEGCVWEGRNLKFQGAHAGNETFNVGNIGVVLIGNFENHEVPDKQKKGLVELVHYLKIKYKISSQNIFSHEHFTGTKCPGKFALPLVEQLQRE